VGTGIDDHIGRDSGLFSVLQSQCRETSTVSTRFHLESGRQPTHMHAMVPDCQAREAARGGVPRQAWTKTALASVLCAVGMC